MFKQMWAAITAKRQLANAQESVRKMQGKSEYEEFLETQLREKAVEQTRVLRETDKLLKLAEAERRSKQMHEKQQRLVTEVLAPDEEDDDSELSDDDNDEDEQRENLAEMIIRKVMSGNTVTPQPTVTTKTQSSPAREKAMQLLNGLTDEQIEGYLNKIAPFLPRGRD